MSEQHKAMVASGDLTELRDWLRGMDVSGMTAAELIAKIADRFPAGQQQEETPAVAVQAQAASASAAVGPQENEE